MSSTRGDARAWIEEGREKRHPVEVKIERDVTSLRYAPLHCSRPSLRLAPHRLFLFSLRVDAASIAHVCVQSIEQILEPALSNPNPAFCFSLDLS